MKLYHQDNSMNWCAYHCIGSKRFRKSMKTPNRREAEKRGRKWAKELETTFHTLRWEKSVSLEGAIDAFVDLFYRKVLGDDRINGFFRGIDMDAQSAKQKAFLAMAFGGPANYTGKDLREGHRHLEAGGLNAGHFDALAGHANATLEELNVPPDLKSEVMAVLESGRPEVLNK